MKRSLKRYNLLLFPTILANGETSQSRFSITLFNITPVDGSENDFQILICVKKNEIYSYNYGNKLRTLQCRVQSNVIILTFVIPLLFDL